jgi:heat shock protein HslJ
MQAIRQLTRFLVVWPVLVVLAACGTSAAGENPPAAPTSVAADPQLAGTNWILIELGDPAAPTPALSDARPTIAFDEQTATGSTGCNEYGTDYTIDGTALTVTSIAQTEMACLDAGVMEQEARYTALLGAVESFTLTNDRLTLTAPEGVLIFERGAGTGSTSEREAAAQTARTFLLHLSAGRYAEAAILYGGSYEMLHGWNPSISAEDHAALWEAGCTINGLQCLARDEVIEVQRVTATEYTVNVTLAGTADERFVHPVNGQERFDFGLAVHGGQLLMRDHTIFTAKGERAGEIRTCTIRLHGRWKMGLNGSAICRLSATSKPRS